MQAVFMFKIHQNNSSETFIYQAKVCGFKINDILITESLQDRAEDN